jgi:RNA polymerase sigma-70 factor (ECF subfamily)
MRQGSALGLFMENRAALVDYASGLTGNRAQAEDVVQEAWLRFDEASERRFLDDPLAYLYRIVRNLALDGRRRMRRESRVVATVGVDTVAELSADARPSPETVLLYKDEYALVMEAIAELPERTRIAVEMHRFGGRKLREIAATLGISVAMAHVLVSEGIQHCKKRLGWP